MRQFKFFYSVSPNLTMIYSRACELGIQAMLYLAMQPEGRPALVRDIAHDLSIPTPYLAKIMQTLSRARLVQSQKGPGGGLWLARPARQIRLLDVVAAVDTMTGFDRCVLGLAECSDENWCPAHPYWSTIKQQILDLLQSKTIGELAREAQQRGLKVSVRRLRKAVNR